MPIVYGVVSREQKVLAEHATVGGNFATVTTSMLGRVDTARPSKTSYSYDGYVWHVLVDIDPSASAVRGLEGDEARARARGTAHWGLRGVCGVCVGVWMCV